MNKNVNKFELQAAITRAKNAEHALDIAKTELLLSQCSVTQLLGRIAFLESEVTGLKGDLESAQTACSFAQSYM